MTVKEYLSGVRWLDSGIRHKMSELESLRATIADGKSVDYSKERVQTSPTSDAPFVKKFEKIFALEKEIDREIDALAEKRHKIINQIQGLSNGIYREILYKRYVEFKRLEVIADEMNYSYSYIRTMHGRALQDFEKIM